jgi:hypothetical protein
MRSMAGNPSVSRIRLCLHTAVPAILANQSPKVSGHLRDYSRSVETAARDWVRSALRAPLALISTADSSRLLAKSGIADRTLRDDCTRSSNFTLSASQVQKANIFNSRRFSLTKRYSPSTGGALVAGRARARPPHRARSADLPPDDSLDISINYATLLIGSKTKLGDVGGGGKV